MTDSLRDQLLGLGFKPQPKPERVSAPGARGSRDVRDAREVRHAREARKPRGTGPSARPAKPAGAGGAGKPRRSQGEIDLAKAYAIRAQKEKNERIEAERLKQEAARQRREARERVTQLLQGKSLNDPGADIARHFEYGGKIKRVHVTEAQLRALNAGELGVVQLDGRYLLVEASVLEQAAAVFPPAVALRVDPHAPAAADPYADPKYRVPDDLVW